MIFLQTNKTAGYADKHRSQFAKVKSGWASLRNGQQFSYQSENSTIINTFKLEVIL